MKTFLAVYVGTAEATKNSGWESMTDVARKERTEAGIKGWHAWIEAFRGSLVDVGAPVGKTKRTSALGVVDARNNISGYSIIQAESHDAAAKMFQGHPHFMIFPGDSVEIMEIMGIPGM